MRKPRRKDLSAATDSFTIGVDKALTRIHIPSVLPNRLVPEKHRWIRVNGGDIELRFRKSYHFQIVVGVARRCKERGRRVDFRNMRLICDNAERDAGATAMATVGSMRNFWCKLGRNCELGRYIHVTDRKGQPVQDCLADLRTFLGKLFPTPGSREHTAFFTIGDDPSKITFVDPEPSRSVSSLLELRSLVDTFCSWYLGSTSQPVPFGGRQQPMGILHGWLDNTCAPPYLLLTGVAGRGKSALLVRWKEAIEKRLDTEVVFFPVSIRLETHRPAFAFRCLAKRLAELHDDSRSIEAETPDLYRGMIAEYLSRPLPNGRNIVVILDGLDETQGWHAFAPIFPTKPGAGVRVVVAARHLGGTSRREWLSRLGWDRRRLSLIVDLSPLDLSGTRDVLAGMADPLCRVANDDKFVAQFHRVTKGEPFLVGLYADALIEKNENGVKLCADTIKDLKPGIKSFFHMWWADHLHLMGTALSERRVQFVLDALSCARGPLSLDELERLCQLRMKVRGSEVEAAVRVVGRFAIGDGRSSGYAISQPALRDFFQDRLTRTDRSDLEECFLDTGRKVMSELQKGAIKPDEVPRYVLLHYGEHLQDAEHDVSEMRKLVTKPWMRAWYHFEGQYEGFLADVERVRAAAADIDEGAHKQGCEVTPHLGVELRCALVAASVQSLGRNVTPELLRALVENRVWSFAEAKAYIGVVSRFTGEAKLWTALGSALSQVDSEASRESLRQALMAVQREARAAKQLPELAFDQLSRTGIVDEPLFFSWYCAPCKDRVVAASRIARHMECRADRAHAFRQALTYAEQVKSRYERINALLCVMYQMAEAGDFRASYAAARRIRHIPHRRAALRSLADWPDVGDEVRVRCLKEAPKKPRSSAHATMEVESMLMHLHEEEVRESGDLLSQAIVHLKDMRDTRLLAMGDKALQEFINLVWKIAREGSRNALSRALVKARQYDSTLFGVTAMAGIAECMKPGRRREQLIAEALAAARALAFGYWPGGGIVFMRENPRDVTALVRVAQVMHDPTKKRSVLLEAAERATRIGDADDCIGILTELPSQVAQCGDVDGGLALAYALPERSCRGLALAHASQEVRNPRRRAQLLAEASRLAATHQVDEPATSAQALLAVAESEVAIGALRRAEKAVRAIQTKSERDFGLMMLALAAESQEKKRRMLLTVARSSRPGLGGCSREAALYLIDVAREDAVGGNIPRGLGIALDLPHGPYRSIALATVAGQAANRETAQKALQIAMTRAGKWSEELRDAYREAALAVACGLVKHDRIPEALTFVRSVLPEAERPAVFLDIGRAVAKSVIQQDLLTEALCAYGNTVAVHWSGKYAEIVGLLTRLRAEGQLEQALRIARDVVVCEDENMVVTVTVQHVDGDRVDALFEEALSQRGQIGPLPGDAEKILRRLLRRLMNMEDRGKEVEELTELSKGEFVSLATIAVARYVHCPRQRDALFGSIRLVLREASLVEVRGRVMAVLLDVANAAEKKGERAEALKLAWLAARCLAIQGEIVQASLVLFGMTGDIERAVEVLRCVGPVSTSSLCLPRCSVRCDEGAALRLLHHEQRLLYELLRNLLQTVRGCGRPALLALLQPLLTVLRHLGGRDTMLDMFDAVTSVSEWWP